MASRNDLWGSEPRKVSIFTAERISLWDNGQPGMCLLQMQVKGSSELVQIWLYREQLEKALRSADYGKALLADSRITLLKDRQSMERKKSEAQLRMRRAKAAYDARMKRYQDLKSWNDDYDQNIRPNISLFKAMMEDIGCFMVCEEAGMGDGQLRACMLNRQGQIRYLLQKHEAELTRLEQDAIKPFPYELFQKPGSIAHGDSLPVPKPESIAPAVSSGSQPVPKPDPLASHCQALQGAIEQGDRASIIEAMKPLQKDLEGVDERALREQIRMLEDRIDKYQQKEKEYIAQTQLAAAECEKRLRYLKSYELHWCYCFLLKKLIPFFREAAALGEEELMSAAPKLQRKLTEIIEQYNQDPRNGQLAFCWKRCDELPQMGTGTAALGYIVHPVLWPGLCAYPKERPEQMFCVVPGHTPPAE